MVKVAIVAAYNNRVDVTLDFLAAHELHRPAGIDLHLILVNGGSDVEIEHPLIAERIDLLVNVGFCNTLNAGLRAVPADADFVFFTGNDSFPLDSNWLPDLIEMQRKTGAWMVCPANDNPGMRAYRDLCKVKHRHYWEVDFFPSICWLMPYDLFSKIGLLDEQFLRTGMYADNDYCQRIRAAGGSIIVAHRIMLRHLLSAEGKVLGTAGEDTRNNLELFRAKWGCDV